MRANNSWSFKSVPNLKGFVKHHDSSTLSHLWRSIAHKPSNPHQCPTCMPCTTCWKNPHHCFLKVLRPQIWWRQHSWEKSSVKTVRCTLQQLTWRMPCQLQGHHHSGTAKALHCLMMPLWKWSNIANSAAWSRSWKLPQQKIWPAALAYK